MHYLILLQRCINHQLHKQVGHKFVTKYNRGWYTMHSA